MEFLGDFDWKVEGRYNLSLSNSSLSVPEGCIAIIGEDARKFYEVNECIKSENIEALVITENFDSFIYFESFESGYISTEDWNTLDSASLLKSIQKNTEKANINRKIKGISTLKVLEWIQEPILDKQSNTVFWALNCVVENTGEKLVNSIGIRLGRKGFEKITWVTDRDNYKVFGGELDVMLRSHSFESGYRYSDFSKGDQVASYGLASLVAATVGGKIVKSGGILLGMKKLWGVIVAGVAALFCKVKNWFRMGDDNK